MYTFIYTLVKSRHRLDIMLLSLELYLFDFFSSLSFPSVTVCNQNRVNCIRFEQALNVSPTSPTYTVRKHIKIFLHFLILTRIAPMKQRAQQSFVLSKSKKDFQWLKYW